MHVNGSVGGLDEALAEEEVIADPFVSKLVHALLWERDALLIVEVSHFGTFNNPGDSLDTRTALRVGLHRAQNGFLFSLRKLLTIKEEMSGKQNRRVTCTC